MCPPGRPEPGTLKQDASLIPQGLSGSKTHRGYMSTQRLCHWQHAKPLRVHRLQEASSLRPLFRTSKDGGNFNPSSLEEGIKEYWGQEVGNVWQSSNSEIEQSFISILKLDKQVFSFKSLHTVRFSSVKGCILSNTVFFCERDTKRPGGHLDSSYNQ